MPTILRIGPYRFHFYSDEKNEPPHIHVRLGNTECKFWLNPIILAKNKGIPSHKLHEIEKYIFGNYTILKEKYNEFNSN